MKWLSLFSGSQKKRKTVKNFHQASFETLESRTLMSATAWWSNLATQIADGNTRQATSVVTRGFQPITTTIGGTPATTTVSAHQFGAKGDGRTDDSAALQTAINSLGARGTLTLEPGVYLLNKGLVVNRSINIQGNGATLLLNTSAWPENTTLNIESSLAPKGYSWNEKIAAGTSTLNVSVSRTALRAGDSVFVELGQDPNDPNEQHFATIAKVISNDGRRIVIDRTVPYAINAGSFNNKITKITSLIDSVNIQNLKFDYVDGQINDIQIMMSRVMNATVNNISGRFTIMANVADSQNVNISNVTGKLMNTHSSAGRVLTAWQSDGVTLTDANVSTSADKAVVFLESWTRQTTVKNLVVNWGYQQRTNSAVLFATGNSYDSYFDNITVNNTAEVSLILSGAQTAEYSFGTVKITGGVRYAPLNKIDSLQIGSKVYDSSKIVTKEINFSLTSNLSDYQIGALSGAIRSITIVGAWPSGLKAIYAVHNGSGSLITSSSPLTSLLNIGSDHPTNNTSANDKTIRIYTGSVPPGTTLRMLIEYWPAA